MCKYSERSSTFLLKHEKKKLKIEKLNEKYLDDSLLNAFDVFSAFKVNIKRKL